MLGATVYYLVSQAGHRRDYKPNAFGLDWMSIQY